MRAEVRRAGEWVVVLRLRVVSRGFLGPADVSLGPSARGTRGECDQRRVWRGKHPLCVIQFVCTSRRERGFEQRRRRTRRRASRPRTCARSGTSPLRSIPSPWTRWERRTRLRARSSVATRLDTSPPRRPRWWLKRFVHARRRTRRFAPHSAPGWRSCSRPSGGATAIPSGARVTPPSATTRTRTSSASTATVSSSGFEKTRISVGYTKYRTTTATQTSSPGLSSCSSSPPRTNTPLPRPARSRTPSSRSPPRSAPPPCEPSARAVRTTSNAHSSAIGRSNCAEPAAMPTCTSPG